MNYNGLNWDVLAQNLRLKKKNTFSKNKVLWTRSQYKILFFVYATHTFEKNDQYHNGFVLCFFWKVSIVGDLVNLSYHKIWPVWRYLIKWVKFTNRTFSLECYEKRSIVWQTLDSLRRINKTVAKYFTILITVHFILFTHT